VFRGKCPSLIDVYLLFSPSFKSMFFAYFPYFEKIKIGLWQCFNCTVGTILAWIYHSLHVLYMFRPKWSSSGSGVCSTGGLLFAVPLYYKYYNIGIAERSEGIVKTPCTRCWPLRPKHVAHLNYGIFIPRLCRRNNESIVLHTVWRCIILVIFLGIWDHHAICVSVYAPYQLSNAWTNLYETWHVYHGAWAHLNGVLNKSLLSVCVCLYIPHNVARQRLSKNVTAATNTHATIEELLDAFFMRPV
jgi:hypothetical protein